MPDQDQRHDLVLFPDINRNGLREKENQQIDFVDQNERERRINCRDGVGKQVGVLGDLDGFQVHQQDQKQVHKKARDCDREYDAFDTILRWV